VCEQIFVHFCLTTALKQNCGVERNETSERIGLQQPLLQTFVSFVNPNITSLQQWNLPVATISPSPDIRDKQSLPLQIPSPDIISDWPLASTSLSNTG
jgi:hypothetical protein